ncbi:GGDEF domain-containing protein [Acetonema longum]|uniref:Response regulator receiver modulated diguanylate cyclase n=1 Tax=Acetonema longum DSM 6540 TaxID=1009370 RepID=F7NG18_9FIRM|nr:diguanylate cyclase [Acetonema longum]EGO64936.1 response regulator receiver modulated diguanylate cyclase [Acetonema longum DSM 6540]
MRVLIAEDAAVNRKVLQDMLTEMGYEPVLARDGNEAMQVLQQDESLQLIILDWVMPGMSGLDVCRVIRHQWQEEYDYKYILMLTGKNREDDLTEGFEAGADDYVVKPFGYNDLKMRLKAGQRIIEMNNKLKILATRDTLTGLYNRQAILGCLGHELAKMKKKKLKIAVAMLDIDHFKSVNDTYGHLAGDCVLGETARRIQYALSRESFVGRVGGEEFLIIFPQADEQTVIAVCENIRKLIGDTAISVFPIKISITISIGVATSDEDETLDGLISRADSALYTGKRQGRDRVVFYSQEA